MALFTADDLRDFLGMPTAPSAERANAVERVVSGRLLGATGLASWPAWVETPPALWALAVELGGIVLENPTSMRSEGLGAAANSWGDRAAEILDEVRSWARAAGILPAGASSVIPLPRGNFPPARPWPDVQPFSSRPPLSDMRDLW